MFWRLIKNVLLRQNQKMRLIVITIAVGASLSTALINVMLGVGEKVNAELKTYGANIQVYPKDMAILDDLYGLDTLQTAKASYLKEDDVSKIKTIFWQHNIVNYTPLLKTQAQVKDTSVFVVGTWYDKNIVLPTGEAVDAGIRNLRNWWSITGDWLTDTEDTSVLVGSLLAERLGIAVGDALVLQDRDISVNVKGIFHSGDKEDEYIYTTLKTAQSLAGLSDQITSLEVSALTTPDNDLARRAAQNPRALTLREWETWYCTAYASAICYQIQEVIPDSIAKPFRQVSESEGDILTKTQTLMVFITVLSMLCCALGISNLITANVMERSVDIGLMKALGASNRAIITTLLTEVFCVGLLGGGIGYGIGILFTHWIGKAVFNSTIPLSIGSIPIVVTMIFCVILIGSLPAMRYLLSLKPTEVLHGK